MVGNTAGHFCEKCPLVVLDREEFKRLAMIAAVAAVATDSVEFVVLGIVDLDAVPEEKRGHPFDDDKNPVPLVRFTNVGSVSG